MCVCERERSEPVETPGLNWKLKPQKEFLFLEVEAGEEGGGKVGTFGSSCNAGEGENISNLYIDAWYLLIYTNFIAPVELLHAWDEFFFFFFSLTSSY